MDTELKRKPEEIEAEEAKRRARSERLWRLEESRQRAQPPAYPH